MAVYCAGAGLQTVEQGGLAALEATVENPSSSTVTVTVRWVFDHNNGAIAENVVTVPSGENAPIQSSATYETLHNVAGGSGTFDVRAESDTDTAPCGSIALAERPEVAPGLEVTACSLPDTVALGSPGTLEATVENTGDNEAQAILQWVTAGGAVVAQKQVAVSPGMSSSVSKVLTSEQWRSRAGVGDVQITPRLTGRNNMVGSPTSEKFSVR